MAPILLSNITFYENRNTDQNGELSIWVMLQRNLRKEQADSQYLFFRDSNMSLVRNQLLTFCLASSSTNHKFRQCSLLTSRKSR